MCLYVPQFPHLQNKHKNTIFDDGYIAETPKRNTILSWSF